MGNQGGSQSWKRELQRWLAPFLAVLGHRARRRWAPVYLLGLLGPGERKSVQPLAARVAPADGEQLHHFVATSRWDTSPLELVLAWEAQRLVGGPDAVLIVDDTALPKQGRCSVGVAHQYCGVLGKQANCQALVSITLARGEVPVPVALRLFLPAEWTRDPARCRRVHVPAARLTFRSKAQIALEELDRLRAAGVTFVVVVADAGFGKSAAFRVEDQQGQVLVLAVVPVVGAALLLAVRGHGGAIRAAIRETYQDHREIALPLPRPRCLP